MKTLSQIVIVAVAMVATQLGCGSSGAPAGAKGGKCYPNNTCNAGLACVAAACVQTDGATPTGAAGTSAAGASGTGGAAGVAGAAGTVEQPDGSAGSSVTGMGGAVGVAGSMMDGGPEDRSSTTDVGDGPSAMEVSLVPRSTCPAGPFVQPKVGTSKSACDEFGVLRYGLTAGPVWVASENAFFFSVFPEDASGGSDLGDIAKYTPGVGCQIVFKDVGTNGLTVAPDGRLIGASFKTRTVSEFDFNTGEAKVLVDKAMGLPLDTPVDVRVHSNGTIYFSNQSTDTAGSGRAMNGVYRADPAGTVVSVSFTAPSMFSLWDGNLVLTPDDKTLFIAGAGYWDLDGAGVPTMNHAGSPLDSRPNSAAAVDCAGDIYLSSAPNGEGAVYTPNLQLAIAGGPASAAGLAFGGGDGKTLFTVNHSNLQVASSSVPGVP